MRNLILALALTLAASTHAYWPEPSVPLTETDVKLTQAQVEIDSMRPICGPWKPKGSRCAAFGTRVRLKITLNGCEDRLGPVFHQVITVDGRSSLLVGAVNIQNDESAGYNCDESPVIYKVITVAAEGLIQLKSMNFSGIELPAIDSPSKIDPRELERRDIEFFQK